MQIRTRQAVKWHAAVTSVRVVESSYQVAGNRLEKTSPRNASAENGTNESTGLDGSISCVSIRGRVSCDTRTRFTRSSWLPRDHRRDRVTLLVERRRPVRHDRDGKQARSITKRQNEVENGGAQAASREHEDKLFGGWRCRPLNDRSYQQSHSVSAHAREASRQFLSVTLNTVRSGYLRSCVSNKCSPVRGRVAGLSKLADDVCILFRWTILWARVGHFVCRDIANGGNTFYAKIFISQGARKL